MRNIQIIQDIDKSIKVMHNVGLCLENIGKSSIYWKPENMNHEYMLKYSEPNEYYVALVDQTPAASMILQETERNQSWYSIDGNNPQKALYLHWLCVNRDFAGQGLSQIMIEFAKSEALKRGYKLLRLDTEGDESKLCSLYEKMGFSLMGIAKEEERNTAFYQKQL